MYTANIKNLLDLFESELPSTWTSTNYKTSIPEYDVKTLEDGKFELTLKQLFRHELRYYW
jgi:hypothetical protein